MTFWQYDNCWLYAGHITVYGYGRIHAESKGYLVHRLMYEDKNGAIAPELVLDHLCRNRACINPDHLEAVTIQENLRRGNGGKLQRERTHCPQGHEYTPENTYKYTYSYGVSRQCKACTIERARLQHA